MWLPAWSASHESSWSGLCARKDTVRGLKQVCVCVCKREWQWLWKLIIWLKILCMCALRGWECKWVQVYVVVSWWVGECLGTTCVGQNKCMSDKQSEAVKYLPRFYFFPTTLVFYCLKGLIIANSSLYKQYTVQTVLRPTECHWAILRLAVQHECCQLGGCTTAPGRASSVSSADNVSIRLQ